MTVGGINGANTQLGQMGMNQATDSYSKYIQNQIANAQKQLQELSSNEEMTLEEKMKKRQEIQQQISDLNIQLRQHQAEQRRKEQQVKSSSMDDMLGGSGNTKAGSKSTGLSQASMTAIISADTSMKQAKVQGSMATHMEGIASVLESEIKMDKCRGGNTEKKEEELADLQVKAQAATESQISTVADAGKIIEEAAKADSKAENNNNGESIAEKEENNKKEDKFTENAEDNSVNNKNITVSYTPVDIRL